MTDKTEPCPRCKDGWVMEARGDDVAWEPCPDCGGTQVVAADRDYGIGWEEIGAAGLAAGAVIVLARCALDVAVAASFVGAW